MELWQRHPPVMSTQAPRGHDEAWWLRLNLMALTLGLVVVVILGSAAWVRLRPPDAIWPPKGPVTYKAAAARPEGHLYYPGARLGGHLGGDERTSGFGQGSGYAGAILLSSDSSSQVRAWYKEWLLGHGWRLMYSGGGDNGIALAKDQYRRGPGDGREGFILYIDDPAQLAATVGGTPLKANTVIEARYIVTPYFSNTATATATILQPTVFVSAMQTMLLRIQFAPNQNDSMRFTFVVNGIGHYDGTFSSIGHDTHGLYRLSGPYPVRFTSQDQASGGPAVLQVSGYLDAANFVGHLRLTVLGAHSHVYDFLANRGNPAAVATLLSQMMAALKQHDWHTLYAQLASGTAQGLTEAQFAQQLQADFAQSGVTLVDITEADPGQDTIRQDGLEYYTQPVLLHMRGRSGTVTAIPSKMMLQRTVGGWKYLAGDAVTLPK